MGMITATQLVRDYNEIKADANPRPIPAVGQKWKHDTGDIVEIISVDEKEVRYRDGGYDYLRTFTGGDCPYTCVSDPTPLRLEVGKSYRARDGSGPWKCTQEEEELVYAHWEGGIDSDNFRRRGFASGRMMGRDDRDWDLVALWSGSTEWTPSGTFLPTEDHSMDAPEWHGSCSVCGKETMVFCVNEVTMFKCTSCENAEHTRADNMDKTLGELLAEDSLAAVRRMNDVPGPYSKCECGDPDFSPERCKENDEWVEKMRQGSDENMKMWERRELEDEQVMLKRLTPADRRPYALEFLRKGCTK